MLYTDLSELKRVIEIDPTDRSEDVKLNFFLEQASQWINDYLGRPDIAYKTRTQLYSGTGTQQLTLRCRPVFPQVGLPDQITVNVDEGAYWGSATGAFSGPNLVYGADYALQIDQDDGSSRSAILWRINNYWNRPSVRQAGLLAPFVGPDTGSIKVTYTAGYTVDTLPAVLRGACNLLVARMRYLMPLGMELTQESYEDRAIGMAAERKDYLMALVKPMIFAYRNWRW